MQGKGKGKEIIIADNINENEIIDLTGEFPEIIVDLTYKRKRKPRGKRNETEMRTKRRKTNKREDIIISGQILEKILTREKRKERKKNNNSPP